MSRPQRVSTDEIIEVARTHFIRRGHSASLKSIAEDLGLSHSALIQRFGSKRALLITALKPPQDFPWPTDFLAGPAPKRDLAIDQLRELCEKLMMFLHVHIPKIKILYSAGVTPQEVHQGCLPLPLVACQRVRAWIEKGVESGLFSPCETAALSSMIVGTMIVRANLMTLCLSHDSIANDSIANDSIANDSIANDLIANDLIDQVDREVTLHESATSNGNLDPSTRGVTNIYSQTELIGSMEGVIENMTRMLFGGGSPEEKSMSEF